MGRRCTKTSGPAQETRETRKKSPREPDSISENVHYSSFFCEKGGRETKKDAYLCLFHHKRERDGPCLAHPPPSASSRSRTAMDGNGGEEKKEKWKDSVFLGPLFPSSLSPPPFFVFFSPFATILLVAWDSPFQRRCQFCDFFRHTRARNVFD